MFHRVLVANRGEIARRIIRSLNSLNIESVAIYSEADSNAPYLKEATKSLCIGPSHAKESYLCEDAILQAALQTECEAIHPGFGFLSENAIFATRCEEQKLSFIGPSAHHLSLMGDKAVARSTMAALGVPTLKGSDGVINDLNSLKSMAKAMGYPVLLKARSGGGGKGMRLVQREEELEMAFMEARREAAAAFSDAELYLEKFISRARHIEFQVLGDHFGNIICLGERECSVQRRNQKLLEEAPANGFSEKLRQETIATIRKALTKIAYRNAGTLEFLLDGSGQLYFMEMNTRIQVEHGITELISGIDIVEWQIRIACNEKLSFKQEDIKFSGHAIECRINAEDPANNFIPSPGTIDNLQMPESAIKGPVRIDTHINNKFKIVPFYDSMLAKVMTHGHNREEALRLMKQALNHFNIEGVKTTKDFHQAILQNEDFKNGTYDCSFIEKHLSQLIEASRS